MQPQAGIEGLSADLARHLSDLGSSRCPPYAAATRILMDLVDGPTADPDVVARLSSCWRDRPFTEFYARPLLLLAALRHEVLVEGDAHPLARGFASFNPVAADVTRERMRAALAPDRTGLWLMLATGRPQTNETLRAVSWMWPARLAGADDGRRPLVLVDIGASAGLNLAAEHLDAPWVSSLGRPLAVVRAPHVLQRLGIDTDPLDPHSSKDRLWLEACLWPGDELRIRRLHRALEIVRQDKLRPPLRLERLNAALLPPRLERMMSTLPPNAFVIAFQTLVRGYFGPGKQEAYERGMATWLSKMPRGSAAWVELEYAGDEEPERRAELAATLPTGSGGVERVTLARTGVHPTVVHEHGAGAKRFQELASF